MRPTSPTMVTVYQKMVWWDAHFVFAHTIAELLVSFLVELGVTYGFVWYQRVLDPILSFS